ncbi:hypothetical protein ABZW30_12975 [Kitasatospora sp. NPDC004669]|uniref:hypothetical protein n=1 Tax=Kitasatospora sp. NPDC004669 TaxID=3154555 RepID=UPI0033B14D12
MTEMSFPNQSTPSPNQPPVPPAGKPPRTTRKIVFSVLGVLVALVVIFAGLVTCRMVTHTAVPSATTDPTPYTRLTKEMTDALAAKDEAAFLKPFKGDELREKRSKVFRNLVRIPWQEARWEQQLVVPQNGSLQVNFVHQVRGVDAKPVAEEYNWRIGHENGVPVITEVGSASDSSAYYPAPWDLYDDLAVENRDHLVVVADKGQSAELERDADVLAQAAKDDLDAWHRVAPSVPSGRQPGPGFFVVLEKNRDVYNKLYAGDGRANDQLEAGVNIGMPADGSTSALEFGGSRIVIDTSLSAFTSANWQEDVSEIGRHEMAHAILAPLETEQVLVAGMQKTQTWVVEGFAEYIAFRGKDNLAQAVTPRQTSRQHCTVTSIRSGSPDPTISTAVARRIGVSTTPWPARPSGTWRGRTARTSCSHSSWRTTATPGSTTRRSCPRPAERRSSSRPTGSPMSAPSSPRSADTTSPGGRAAGRRPV